MGRRQETEGPESGDETFSGPDITASPDSEVFWYLLCFTLFGFGKSSPLMKN